MNNVMPVIIVVMIICVRLEFRNIQILLASVAFRFCMIIASEQSGVECACACTVARVLCVVQNFVVAYLELRRTLWYVQRP